MKTLLFITMLCFWQGQKPEQLGVNHKPTRYKPQFSYYTNGQKATLLKWIKVGSNIYRWRTRFEYMGQSYLGWTDDEWIDVATKKAFLNEQTHQIVYYDSVQIVPRRP